MGLAQVNVQYATVITVTAIINQALRITVVSGLGSKVDGCAVFRDEECKREKGQVGRGESGNLSWP